MFLCERVRSEMGVDSVGVGGGEPGGALRLVVTRPVDESTRWPCASGRACSSSLARWAARRPLGCCRPAGRSSSAAASSEEIVAAPLGGPRGSVAGRLGRRWWCRGDPAPGRGEGREDGVPLPGLLPRPPPSGGARGPGSDWRKAPGARRAASSSGAVQARAPGGDPLAVPCGRRTARVARTGVDHAGGGPWSRARTAPGGLGQAGRPVAFPRALRSQAGAPPLRSARPGRAPVGRIGAHAAPFKEAPSPSPGVQILKATCSGAVHAPRPRRCGFGRPRHPVAGGGPSARTLMRIASRRITG